MPYDAGFFFLSTVDVFPICFKLYDLCKHFKRQLSDLVSELGKETKKEKEKRGWGGVKKQTKKKHTAKSTLASLN